MNSSGLGILITSLTSLRNAGGDLKICGASDRIESLLMVTKLITVFKHYKTLDEAVAAYQEQLAWLLYLMRICIPDR
jgi:anti-sigma B factor antagonist